MHVATTRAIRRTKEVADDGVAATVAAPGPLTGLTPAQGVSLTTAQRTRRGRPVVLRRGSAPNVALVSRDPGPDPAYRTICTGVSGVTTHGTCTPARKGGAGTRDGA